MFIVFITCSLGHMLVTIKMCQLLQQHLNADQHPYAASITAEQSLKWKRILFALSIVSTIGLAVFFFKHRVYCHDLAFSAFAFCEYVIAIANLAFHCTTLLDFPSQYLMIANGSSKIKLHQPLGWKSDWIVLEWKWVGRTEEMQRTLFTEMKKDQQQPMESRSRSR